MRKWTKTTGLLFLAAASVYSGEVIGATPAGKGKVADAGKNTDVKLLEDQQHGDRGDDPPSYERHHARRIVSSAPATRTRPKPGPERTICRLLPQHDGVLQYHLFSVEKPPYTGLSTTLPRRLL